MKSIENKETEIIEADEEGKPIGKCTYAGLITLLMKRGKQGGFDWNDVENRLKITAATKDCNGTIELEDAEFKYLKKIVETATWPFYHKDLLSFKEDIVAIK